MRPPEGKSVVHDDGPEEGEIVSDDLEDISDDSTFFAPTNGKSLSRKDHLHALSLSSITDQDERQSTPMLRQKRRKCSNRRHVRYLKKIKRVSVASESSDDECDLNSRLKRQLKAAVRVDSDEASRNSLLTRLKPMIQNLPSDLDQNSVNLAKESDILIGTSNGPDSPPATEPIKELEDDHDSELRELRLEALKTALANKFGKRKTKKKDDNKENSVNNEAETPLKTQVCVEDFSSAKVKDIASDPVSPEEDDEDVLRALLLASMSKKITKTKTEPVQIKVPPKHTEKQTKLVKIRTTSATNNNFKVNNVQKPVTSTVSTVKPLIICVDSDSSETDFQESPAKVPGKYQNGEKSSNQIESSVEKFLKEQRAKVELQKKIQTKPARTNGAVRKQMTKTLNKSTLECLPKEKQKEYKNLVLMIRKAEQKKPRLRRTLVRGLSESSKPIVTIGKNTMNKSSTTSTVVSTKLLLTNRPVGGGIIAGNQGLPGRNEPAKSPAKLDDKASSALLEKTLKEVQLSRQDGRFQVQEKYKLLRPLIKKIQDLTKEQKRSDQDVNNMLQQLAKAKCAQQEAQKNLTICIKDLVIKKQRIDRCLVQRVCSTPINGAVAKKIQPPNASGGGVKTTASKTDDNHVVKPKKRGLEQKPDVEKHATTKELAQGGSRYISPLDTQSKPQNLDPYTEMCPYEANGTCKDADCTYNHLR